MGAYLLKRVLLIFPTLLGIMLISFAVIQFAPGGPVERVIAQLSGTDVSATARIGGSQSDSLSPSSQSQMGQAEVAPKYRGAQGLDPEFVKSLEKQFGLDKPAPERFLLLKRYNIRTIFDLERAVLGVNAPDELKLVIGAILMGSDKAMTAVRTEFEIKPLDIQGTAFDATLAKAMTIDTIEHLVRVMIDDLHVHRLRQIWLHIARRLGIKTAQLEDTKPLRNRLEKCQQCGTQRITSVAAAQPPPPNGASAAP